MNKGNCYPTKLIFFCLFCFLLFRMRRKSETGHRAKRKREKSEERTILPLQPGRPHGTLATPPLLYSAEYLFYMLEKCLLLHTSRFCRAPLFSFFFIILNFFFLFFFFGCISPGCCMRRGIPGKIMLRGAILCCAVYRVVCVR